MNRYGKRHSIVGVFVFLLLGVFAVFGTILVLVCAQAYRGSMERTAQHNEQRIMQSVIRHAVRAEDSCGAVTVQEFDGVHALCIADDAEDEHAYVTYIYVYNGALCEQYADRASGFRPERGETLCRAADFHVEIDGARLTAEITDADGAPSRLTIALYGSEVTP